MLPTPPASPRIDHKYSVTGHRSPIHHLRQIKRNKAAQTWLNKVVPSTSQPVQRASSPIPGKIIKVKVQNIPKRIGCRANDTVLDFKRRLATVAKVDAERIMVYHWSVFMDDDHQTLKQYGVRNASRLRFEMLTDRDLEAIDEGASDGEAADSDVSSLDLEMNVYGGLPCALSSV